MEEFLSIENVIFTIGEQGVSLIELFSVLLGLTTVFLATQRRVLNFWVGYAYNIALFILFYQKGLYSSMLLQPVSFAINFFGHYRWTHPKEGEANEKNELKISLLTIKERIFYSALILMFVILWGAVLSNASNIFGPDFRPARIPYLDSFVTAMILIAQLLSAQKKLDCWGAWLVVNVTNIVLYILAGLAFMPIVSASYLIMALFGFAMWYREWKGYEK